MPIAEQVDWSIDYTQPLVTVTQLNQPWDLFVKGVSGWTGTFSGNFDKTSTLLWDQSVGATAASDFYLYPMGATAMGQYYYGSCFVVPGKLSAGSVTAKASNTFKVTGQGILAHT